MAAFTYDEQGNEILSALVVTADTPTAIRPTTWGSVKMKRSYGRRLALIRAQVVDSTTVGDPIRTP